MLLLLSYCNIYGIYGALGALINNIVAPYHFTAYDSGLFGTTFILTGIVSSFIVSSTIDKTKRFLLAYRLLSFAGLIIWMTMYITLPLGKTFWLSLNLGLLGAALVPIVPLGFSFSVELTHPVSEPMSNGVLVLAA